MQPHKELKTCTLLGASYTPKLINSWTLRKTGPPGKGHSSEPRPIFELLRGVCKFWLSWLDGVFRIIWKYGHPRAIPDANIINEKSRNTTELKKLLYRVKYWSPNACIVLHYPMLCIPGNSWQKILIMPRSTKIAKASGNHSCIDTCCMLIWCTTPTDENQQTNPLRTVQVLSNSWMCLLWWKQFRTSSRNSDFSGDLPWHLNKASPKKSKNIRIRKVFPCVSFCSVIFGIK